MKRALYALPFLVFVALAIAFYMSLNGPAPDVLPSAMIGKPVPARALPALDAATQGFSPRDLTGHVTVVNVFASWCIPCRAEAPALAQLAADKSIALYGFVYKDKPEAARGFLNELGDPFARIGLDADGSTAIDWGVYGVPETYVVDAKGIIRERFVGPLDANALSTVIEPAIQRARI
ncbi:MAG TPA: DsbE family thiol:disulfide interchange protein [Rhizomicrobium sp.]|jgi:cytochrome c biogenesis protein CcmG/thiol:disulfide interchange protein DsbE